MENAKNSTGIALFSDQPFALTTVSEKIEDKLFGVPRKLLFSERIWSVKKEENLTFDLGDDNFYDEKSKQMTVRNSHYSLPDVVQMALDKEYKTFYSDTRIEYYLNGDRAIVDCPPKIFIDPRGTYCKPKGEYSSMLNEELFFVDMRKAKILFPEQKAWFESLEIQYPRVKWRFAVTHNTRQIEVAMSYHGVCDKNDFKEIMYMFQQNRWPENIRFSSLGNLRSRFHAIADIVENGGAKAFEEKAHLSQIEVCFAEKRTSIKLYAGYNDIAFNVINSDFYSEEDQVAMRKKFARAKTKKEEKFNLTVTGKTIEDSSGEFKYDKEFGCCTDESIILPLEVFQKWGKAWTTEELAKIQRLRTFDYENPDVVLFWKRVRTVNKVVNIASWTGALAIAAIIAILFFSGAIGSLIVPFIKTFAIGAGLWAVTKMLEKFVIPR